MRGNATTLLIVNLSPEKDEDDESLFSLRSAAKVNECQIGIAKEQHKKKKVIVLFWYGLMCWLSSLHLWLYPQGYPNV